MPPRLEREGRGRKVNTACSTTAGVRPGDVSGRRDRSKSPSPPAASFLLRFGWSSGPAIALYLAKGVVPHLRLEQTSYRFSDSTLFERIALHDATIDGAADGPRRLRETLIGQTAPVIAARRDLPAPRRPTPEGEEPRLHESLRMSARDWLGWSVGALCTALVAGVANASRGAQGRDLLARVSAATHRLAESRSRRVLLALVSPDRTAALTYLTDDPSFSYVTQEAKSVGPRVTANAEQVIALDPDLIVSGVTRAEMSEKFDTSTVNGYTSYSMDFSSMG